MKNLKYIIALLTLAFFSCQEEKDPVGYIANSYQITSPSNGASFTTNPNQTSATAFTLTWSPVDFGYNAAVQYSMEILYGGTTKTIILGSYNENSGVEHSYLMNSKALNDILYILLSKNVATSATFSMRIKAMPIGQSTEPTVTNGLISYTDYVTFNCNVYDPIDEAAKLYVMGNFGAASTFADWDINTTGTSNSPIIYSALNNNIYEGFVYMNVASPQFKFANPTTTDLNIKGVATAYTGTSLLNVSDPSSPFGDSAGATGLAAPGTLLATTDVSTGNVIIPPAATASSYYIKAKWDTNQYVVLKRKMSITGSATGYVPKVLTYDTNPASPFYRMYVGTNLSLVGGFFYIQVKDNSSATASKLERFGLDNTQTSSLQLTTSSSAPAKNLIKFGGTNVDIVTPGSYTIALDLRNSARYNFIAIKN